VKPAAVPPVTLASVVAIAALSGGESGAAPEWPVWRGPFGNGSATGFAMAPVEGKHAWLTDPEHEKVRRKMDD